MGMRFGGGDRWMDSPKWNKSGVETYNDWDNRGKGFEDANNRYMFNICVLIIVCEHLRRNML